jgi:single-stranded-DNA-specific exonuclease
MNKLWKIKPCDDVLADALCRELEDLPRPLVSVLVQRGCKTAEEATAFMNPSLSALCDPFELPGMERAVERIRRALAAGEKICVFGDYDVDGVCSTALLVRVLRSLGGTVSAFIPGRLETGYGLSPEALESCLAEHHPALIVTVDCGTNASAAVEAARTAGVDVVVTDHHEPDADLASAVAVVNPKLEPGHPAQILAGAGVTFKLCHALVKAGRSNGCTLSASVDLREILDFVAVATVTDMVPLLCENRALVRAGFQTLENSRCAGWKALIAQAGIKGSLETWHASFTLGPRINAAGRVGRAAAALELFLTDLPVRAKELAELLENANRERQTLERKMVAEAMQEIENRFDPRKDFGLVIAREGWHPGVIGIVASRLVNRYHRPVAVIGLNGESGRGSCRSIDGFNILDGLTACTDLLTQFGGHAMAAGLEVPAKNIKAFNLRFNEAAAVQLEEHDLRPVLEIDRVLKLDEVDEALLDGLKRTGPFGQDNPEPVWAAHNIDPSDSKILKEKHLKLTLSDGAVQHDAIGFNMAAKLPDGPVDIAFTIQENNWNGRTSLQLLLKDIRPAD